jgi:hypothetical protein
MGMIRRHDHAGVPVPIGLVSLFRYRRDARNLDGAGSFSFGGHSSERLSERQ